MVTAKVHRKYLVVVPKELREKLDIKVGDIVEFRVENDKVVLVPRLRKS